MNNKMNIKTLKWVICLLSVQIIFAQESYTADWESIKNYEVPEWYEDAKLGFWVTWGGI